MRNGRVTATIFSATRPRPGEGEPARVVARSLVDRVGEAEPAGYELQWRGEVVRVDVQDRWVQRVAQDRQPQSGHVHPQLVGLPRGGRQPVARELAARLDELDKGLRVRFPGHHLGLQAAPALLDPAGYAARELERRVERRQRLIGLVHPACLEEAGVGGPVLAVGGEYQHARGETVQPVRRREVGQPQGVAQPDQYRFPDVGAARGGGQEVRLVDHHDARVHVQHLDREGHDRLGRQRPVEPYEGVRPVGLIPSPGAPRLVDELTGFQHLPDRDYARDAVDEEVAHRGPSRVGVRIVVGSAYPRRIQPLPLGQWRAGRHHATGSGPDEVTTADYG